VGLRLASPAGSRTRVNFPNCATCDFGWRSRLPFGVEDGLYRLVQCCYHAVRDEWEERYERRYGFWRAAVMAPSAAHRRPPPSREMIPSCGRCAAGGRI